MPSLAETKVILKDLLNIPENKVTMDVIQTEVCKFLKLVKMRCYLLEDQDTW